jgi:uncharacterized protein YkwD
MRAARVIGTALLAAGFLAVPGVAPADALVGAPPAAEAATPAQEMLTLVNAERSKAGCAPVRLDSRLTTAASKHSTDMATNNYFSHTSRNGATFVTRIKAEGYPTPRSENIAAGNTTAQATFKQWMNSSGHRRNILDCTAKDMGVGVASNPRSTYRTYWTQDFGRG